MGTKILEQFDNIFSKIRNEDFRKVVKELAEVNNVELSTIYIETFNRIE